MHECLKEVVGTKLSCYYHWENWYHIFVFLLDRHFTPDSGVMKNTFLLHSALHLNFHFRCYWLNAPACSLHGRSSAWFLCLSHKRRCVKLGPYSSTQKEDLHADPTALRECCFASDWVHSMSHMCQSFSQAEFFIFFWGFSWVLARQVIRFFCCCSQFRSFIVLWIYWR